MAKTKVAVSKGQTAPHPLLQLMAESANADKRLRPTTISLIYGATHVDATDSRFAGAFRMRSES